MVTKKASLVKVLFGGRKVRKRNRITEQERQKGRKPPKRDEDVKKGNR